MQREEREKVLRSKRGVTRWRSGDFLAQTWSCKSIVCDYQIINLCVNGRGYHEPSVAAVKVITVLAVFQAWRSSL